MMTKSGAQLDTMEAARGDSGQDVAEIPPAPALRKVEPAAPETGDGSSEETQVLCQRLTRTALVPRRATEGSIGIDIHADLGIGETMLIVPGHTHKIPTGVAMKAPNGHYLRVAPRSGLAIKGLAVNAGVIDLDYIGQIFVIVFAVGPETIEIKHGDRVAQVIAERATICGVTLVSKLDATIRGASGFGSSGA